MADQDFRSTLSVPGTDRVMPQNLDAERAVLAAAILNNTVLEDLVTELRDSSVFYRPAHQKIYESIIELNTRGTEVDQISLADRLAARGELEEVGGKPYIIELASNSFALANWRNHLEIVKRTALLRDLIKASTRIIALSYDAPDDADAVVEEAERRIMEVTDRRVTQGFIGVEDLLAGAFKEIEAMADRQSHIIGVPTGYPDLDRRLGGLRGGSLMILAARPAVGKTAFVLNLAINAAMQGVRVGLFSLEMGAQEIMPRVISAQSGIELQRIRTGKLQDGDWSAIYDAADRLSNLDFAIDDTPSLSILEMRAKARRRMHGRPDKGLIIVDYLQLMEPQNKRTESRQVEIAEISRGLKILAKELDVPVIALSQLSRGIEQRADKRPMLSDLRESGAIEQDADIVAFLDRSTSPQEAAQSNRPDEGIANLIVAKNRHGETGTTPMVFIPHCTRFESMAREETN